MDNAVPAIVVRHHVDPYHNAVAALDDLRIHERCDAAVAAARAAIALDPARHQTTALGMEYTRSPPGSSESILNGAERRLRGVRTAARNAMENLSYEHDAAESVCAESIGRAPFLACVEVFKSLPTSESYVDCSNADNVRAIDGFVESVVFERIHAVVSRGNTFYISQVIIDGSARVATIGSRRGWRTSAARCRDDDGKCIPGIVGTRFFDCMVLAARGERGPSTRPWKESIDVALDPLPTGSPLTTLPWRAVSLLLQIATLTVLNDPDWADDLECAPDYYGSDEAFSVFAEAVKRRGQDVVWPYSNKTVTVDSDGREVVDSGNRPSVGETVQSDAAPDRVAALFTPRSCQDTDPFVAIDQLQVTHRCSAAVTSVCDVLTASPQLFKPQEHFPEKRHRSELEPSFIETIHGEGVIDAVERRLLHIEAVADAALNKVRAERVGRVPFLAAIALLKTLPQDESTLDVSDAAQLAAVDAFTRAVSFDALRVVEVEIKPNVTDQFFCCEVVVAGALRAATVASRNDYVGLDRGRVTSFGPADSTGTIVGKDYVWFEGGTTLCAEGEHVEHVELEEETTRAAMELLPRQSPLRAMPWEGFALLLRLATMTAAADPDFPEDSADRTDLTECDVASRVYAQANHQ